VVAAVTDACPRDRLTHTSLARLSVPQEEATGADETVVVERLDDRNPSALARPVGGRRDEREGVVVSAIRADNARVACRDQSVVATSSRLDIPLMRRLSSSYVTTSCPRERRTRHSASNTTSSPPARV
jgi:hypothetical protein